MMVGHLLGARAFCMDKKGKATLIGPAALARSYDEMQDALTKKEPKWVISFCSDLANPGLARFYTKLGDFITKKSKEKHL